MWISLFAAVIAIAIFLSVASFLMSDQATNASLMFATVARRSRNMSEMMDRLGIDAEALARVDVNLNSVYRACQLCPADEACREWLTRESKALKRAPAFCANAERFAHAKAYVGIG